MDFPQCWRETEPSIPQSFRRHSLSIPVQLQGVYAGKGLLAERTKGRPVNQFSADRKGARCSLTTKDIPIERMITPKVPFDLKEGLWVSAYFSRPIVPRTLILGIRAHLQESPDTSSMIR